MGKLGLNAEAHAALEGFRAKSRMRKGLRRCIEGLLGLENGSDYERNYRLNETYFGKKGIKTGTYDQVNLKYCCYLGNEYIYNKDSHRILLAVTKAKSDNLQFSTNDTLLICDTDDSGIYHELKRMFQESAIEIRQSLSVLPIFIIEHQLAHGN